MTVQIKAKEMLDKFYPILDGALSGKYIIDENTYVEIFGKEFSFYFRKDKDYITIVFSGKKPKINAKKGIWFISLDFEADIISVSFNKKGGFVKLDGLPQQNFEFV